jgi:hypothetical protein
MRRGRGWPAVAGRVVVGLLALLVAARASAQSSTGGVLGLIQDESSAAVPGVSVTVRNTATGVARTVTTDGAGRFRVPELIPGPYEVRAQLQGFQSAVRQGVQVTVGSEVVVDLQLRVGGLAEETVVTAQRALVDTTTATVAGLVDEKTVRELPLNGRSFDQLITLESSAPMINARGRTSLTGQGNVFSVGGARTQSNQYLMDGTELIGAGSITTQPGGALGKNMGVEAIQEFQVLTGSYSAQYGKRAGGVINIATRSGTNQFRGSVFEFHRDDRMDARNFFDPGEPPPFTRNQYGGAFGGPIVKGRTFFFGNFEGLRETLGLTNIAIVPDDNARHGLLPDPAKPGALLNVGVAPGVAPYLSLWPAVNGRNFGDGTAEAIGTVTRESRQDFGLVRFDHRLSSRDSLFGRYNQGRAHLSDPSANPYFVSLTDSTDRVLTLEAKRLYQKVLNSLRVGYTRASITSDSEPTISIDPSLVFLPGAKTIGPINFGSNNAAAPVTQAGTDTSAERYFQVSQLDLRDEVMYFKGAHSLKTGVQVQHIDHDENFQNSVRGSFQFADLTGFLKGTPTVFQAPSPTEGGGSAAKDYRQVFAATYLQDDYAVRPNVTLNLGVRYELMTVPIEKSGDRIANYRADVVGGQRVLQTAPVTGSPFFRAHHGNVAPRLGVVWDPTHHATMSIRGGFGMFYDEIENEFRFFTANNAPFFSLVQVSNGSFPNGFATSTGAARTPAPDALDFNIRTPVRQQWNVGVEKQVFGSAVVNVGYVGSRSYHLTNLSDANTAVPQLLADGTKFYAAGLKRKNPALGASRFVSSEGRAEYNALQIDFTQRPMHGLRSKVSFTYGKSMDDTSALVSQHSTASPATPQDPTNVHGDWGPSAFDVRRNFVANLTYDLPAGHLDGLARAVLSHWQVSAILTLQDGTPFTALTGFSQSRDLARSVADRPNLAPGASSNPILGGTDHYFDTSAFVLQAPGTYGNVGRNTLVGPGLETLDATVVRLLPCGGARVLQLRLEAFNVLNHANFSLPDANIFNSNGTVRGAAGRITSTSTSSRQIQLGAKFAF